MTLYFSLSLFLSGDCSASHFFISITEPRPGTGTGNVKDLVSFWSPHGTVGCLSSNNEFPLSTTSPGKRCYVTPSVKCSGIKTIIKSASLEKFCSDLITIVRYMHRCTWVRFLPFPHTSSHTHTHTLRQAYSVQPWANSRGHLAVWFQAFLRGMCIKNNCVWKKTQIKVLLKAWINISRDTHTLDRFEWFIAGWCCNLLIWYKFPLAARIISDEGCYGSVETQSQRGDERRRWMAFMKRNLLDGGFLFLLIFLLWNWWAFNHYSARFFFKCEPVCSW